MNSSSSSSDYSFDECYCNGVDSNTEDRKHAWAHPFFYNTTQPLVYYTQVQPACKRHTSREIRKDSPNCFVKAFRWYTQEHVPPQRNQFSNFNSNVTGFAAWLDTKYLQFVREGQLNQSSHIYKLQQTSSLEASKTIKQTNSKTRRKRRVKSPWRKRRNQNKEGGDMTLKSHHSFEYILQPKEMTRNVSEWCQPTPATLRNRSNMTNVSNEVCNCKKPATKSLSLTSVYQDNKSNATFLTTVIPDEKKDTFNKPKFTRTLTRDVSCQCVLKVASKISTGTQYENSFINVLRSDEIEIKSKLLSDEIRQPSSLKSLVEIPKKGTVRKMVREFDPRRHVSCQCTDKTTKIDVCCQCDAKYITCDKSNYSSQETSVPIEKRLSKQLKSVTTNTVIGLNSNKNSIHNAAQTSDHPINLDNGLIQQYPFFMRIVCADKLCDDCNND
ncbi:uncharacterized protein LOC115446986 isoform X1 [Manduca sexta]|uniref:uncharacterized protein LOC115446986 isoform X1 n=1 Tax=Manduca sexta TaxID=7130 RepID=UPI001181D02F|nr:uncharacterized protein LOC115446986 isoform X1 [Manduca sexta]